MSDESRIPLARAEQVAAEVMALLSPYCDRLEIAGSIRRRRPDVGDIELLAVPKTTERVIDLFGDQVETENHLDDFMRAQLAEAFPGFRHRHDKNGYPAFGPRYKRLLYLGYPLDLFSCLPPAQWGVLMAIRTGPAEFSRRLVTPRRRGGMLPDGYSIRDGQLWRSDVAIHTPTEETLFGELGLDYIPPEER